MSAAAWQPRLVALDVDGTVFNPDTQSISPRVREAVRRVTDAGSQLVLATGRSMLGTLPVLAELDLHSGMALCSNGAVRLDASAREAVAVETFDPAPVHRKLAGLLPGALFAAEHVGTRTLVTSPFPPDKLHGPQQLATIEELVGRPVPRLIANWAGHPPAELSRVMEGVWLLGATYTVDHYEPWVTVVPDGVTKGAALEKLRTELGIPIEDTLAIGDGDNDLQMLEWAAHGIAMGQSPASVRAAADETTATVDADGVAVALRKWF